MFKAGTAPEFLKRGLFLIRCHNKGRSPPFRAASFHQLNADYTLFGSLTVFGNSISIDAKMVDVTGNTPTTSFFDQSQDLGGVITKINQIAAQINANVFDRQPKVARKAAPAPQASKTAP
ncbi:unnamed protein product, partial [marine sediment metagenome]